MNWKQTQLSEFLIERDGRIKYEIANQLGLQRIKKIDFSGNIHLDAETDTKTDMIRVKSGDLVVSGINAAKGAIAVHTEDDDVLATIHYSAYEFNSDRISVEFLKWFFKSPEFSDLLKKQIPGGIKTELKPKHILPLQVKLPDLAEQIKVAERLDRFRLEQIKLEHEITHQQSLLAKLKQAILQEAIEGKLTSDWRASHPEVEPASELLERIQAEKASLIAAKKLRPEKPLPKITPAEIPFEIPKGWEWCRIGDQIKISGGSQPNKGVFIREPREGYTRFIQIRDFKSDDYRTYIPTQLANRMFTKDDILIGRYGPPVFQILRGLEGTYNVALMKAEPRFGGLINDFLFYLLQEPRIQKIVIKESERTAGQTGVRLPLLNEIVFPLPPLAEQVVIVERVESLMATCRALESEIEQTRTHAAHLLQAVLKEAFAPAST